MKVDRRNYRWEVGRLGQVMLWGWSWERMREGGREGAEGRRRMEKKRGGMEDVEEEVVVAENVSLGIDKHTQKSK